MSQTTTTVCDRCSTKTSSLDGDYVEGSLRLQLGGCGSVDVPYHVDRRVDRWVGSSVILRWVICVHEAEAYEAILATDRALGNGEEVTE